MLIALFLLFVILPFIDLVLLLRIGSVFGFWPTVAITIAMGALGAWLSKREGLRVFRAWRQALRELRPPSEGIIDGVLVFMGGALLIAPGVLTDLIGFAFLIPFTRRPIAALVRSRIDQKLKRGDIHVMTSTFGSMDAEAPSPFARDDFEPMRPRRGVVDTTGESVDQSGEQPPLLRDRRPS